MLTKTKLTKQINKLHQKVYLKIFFTVGHHMNAELCLCSSHCGDHELWVLLEAEEKDRETRKELKYGSDNFTPGHFAEGQDKPTVKIRNGKEENSDMYNMDGVEIVLNPGSNQNLLDWKAISPIPVRTQGMCLVYFNSLIKHA